MSTSENNEFFDKIDTRGNGVISPPEFEKHIKELQNNSEINLSNSQVQEVIDAMDKDTDGNFSIKEAIGWMVTAGYLPESNGLGFGSKLAGRVRTFR